MIKPIEKQRIIKVLGKHYTKPILNELARKKILNGKNEPFLAENIRKIVAGTWENASIEIAVLQLVKKTENAKKRQDEKRKKLISKK